MPAHTPSANFGHELATICSTNKGQSWAHGTCSPERPWPSHGDPEPGVLGPCYPSDSSLCLPSLTCSAGHKPGLFREAAQENATQSGTVAKVSTVDKHTHVNTCPQMSPELSPSCHTSLWRRSGSQFLLQLPHNQAKDSPVFKMIST